MSLRRLAAVWTAKIAHVGCKAVGKQGATLAGKLALRIDPSILKELGKQVKKEVFVVCGTNGKTTTNNILYSVLKAEGKKVVYNHTGSNMLNGVVSAFVLAAKWTGNLDADYACIEIDEASTVRVFPHLKPDYMIVTNLFRDQLDRYGEIDATMNFLKTSMQMAPDMKVIVNGDDALTTFIAMESGNEYITYGIGERYFKDGENLKEMHEGNICKKCGGKLHYNFYHYSQLGDYECISCDFKRPELNFNAKNITEGGKLSFDVDNFHISASYRGFYNVYNILAVYAATKSIGLTLENFNEVLETSERQYGRMEHFSIKGTDILLNLAKNPAGFNQNVMAVLEDKKDKDIIILVNDKEQDGIDVTWLWDVDFDKFADESVKSITTCGLRRQDLSLRLKYVGVSSVQEADIEKAIRDRIEHGVGNLYLLVNFTGLLGTHNVLKKLEAEK